MQFSQLASYLEKLEKTASRNEMTRLLAEALKKAGEEEVDKICYLLLGELLPAYRGVEFNLAEKTMIRVLESVYDTRDKTVLKLYKASGDLGDVAFQIAKNRKPRIGNQKLSVAAVYDGMLEVAKESGRGSQGRKIRKMAGILSRLDPLSAKYVTRIPVGKLRLGFSDATLLDALSLMERGDKSARPEIERAFNATADIGEIAKRVKKSGLGSLKKLEVRPGVPVRASLAERLKSVEEVLQKAGPWVGVEAKLDGFRTQIHIWKESGKKQVALFSRNLENTTPMFPEIVSSAMQLEVRDAILDGETIGYDPKTGKFAQFQETVQRKRKYGIGEFVKKIPLSIFVFDILYLDGKTLIELPFRERRKILERVLDKKGGTIRLTAQKITDDPELIRTELKMNLDAGLEGLVVKNLELPYQAGSRGFHWIKLKATTAMLEKLRAGSKAPKSGGGLGLPDTIDCVVMGAYKGRGKRAEFGIGGLLLGVRGREDKYYTISRLGSGLSDSELRETSRRVSEIKVAEPPKDYEVDKEIAPDIWVKPSLVVEILADEITLSPRHTAGRKKGRGYSLRFPRLVRFRDDKRPEDSTAVEEVEKMYKKQK